MNRVVRLAREIDRSLDRFHKNFIFKYADLKMPQPKCSVCKCRLTEKEVDESLLDPAHMLLCDECFDETRTYAIPR